MAHKLFTNNLTVIWRKILWLELSLIPAMDSCTMPLTLCSLVLLRVRCYWSSVECKLQVFMFSLILCSSHSCSYTRTPLALSAWLSDVAGTIGGSARFFACAAHFSGWTCVQLPRWCQRLSGCCVCCGNVATLWSVGPWWQQHWLHPGARNESCLVPMRKIYNWRLHTFKSR